MGTRKLGIRGTKSLYFIKKLLTRRENALLFKVNELRYKQCGVTPHFSTGQYLFKRILRKAQY